MRRAKRIGVALLALGCILPPFAVAGRLVVANTQAVVTEWRPPEVHRNADGSVTYIPSVPATVEYGRFGAFLDAGVKSTSVSRPDPNEPDTPLSFDVRLKNGRIITVDENEWFTAGGRRYRVFRRADELYVQSRRSGKVKQLSEDRYRVAQ